MGGRRLTRHVNCSRQRFKAIVERQMRGKSGGHDMPKDVKLELAGWLLMFIAVGSFVFL